MTIWEEIDQEFLWLQEWLNYTIWSKEPRQTIRDVISLYKQTGCFIIMPDPLPDMTFQEYKIMKKGAMDV